MTDPERIQPTRSSRPIAPVHKERRLALPPEAAFRLFTDRMGSWWPLASHSIGGAQAADVRFEGRPGGQVIELTTSGDEYPWADVLEWQPPKRVVLSWHPTIEVVAATVIEVTFEPSDGGTVLHLEHREWESYGEGLGTELRNGYEPGWDVVLAALEAQSAK